MLGGLKSTNGDHAWGHYPKTTPLHSWLKEQDLLDPEYPALKP